MRTKVLLIRCNSGHYFSGGKNCPLDNWSLDRYENLEKVLAQIEKDGVDISIEELKRRGISNDTLARLIVVDFGSVNSVFYGLAPEGYIGKQGNFIPLKQVGLDYL